MIIGGVQKTTLIDYPGQIASIIFTKGCNFDCPWCHNGPILKDDGESIDPDEVISFLHDRKKLIDGVVISGGEPTFQDDLENFIIEIKKMNLLIKLDTNGGRPDRLKPLLDKKLLNYVAMDVKAPLEDYSSVIGVKGSEHNISQSISMIMELAPDYEFRTTFIPGLVEETSAKGIAQMIEGAKIHYLQAFRPTDTIISPDFQVLRGFTLSELERCAEHIRPYVKEVKIRY